VCVWFRATVRWTIASGDLTPIPLGAAQRAEDVSAAFECSLPVVTRLARALSVVLAPRAAESDRDDVVRDRARRESFAEVRDLAQRIAIQNEPSPSLVTSSVTTARRRAAALPIELMIRAGMLRAESSTASPSASWIFAEAACRARQLQLFLNFRQRGNHARLDGHDVAFERGFDRFHMVFEGCLADVASDDAAGCECSDHKHNGVHVGSPVA
jgi:hypothetical protein